MAASSGGDRNFVVGQRPDHAAGDGCGGVSDGRVRRYSLFRNHPARIHPGRDQLYRAVLHRASGSDAARHGADGESARANRQRAVLSWALGLAGTIAALCAIYYVAIGTQAVFGGAAPWILGALLIALYIYSTWVAAREPDLPVDIDVDNPVLPPAWPTVKAGMHFLIPIGVLLWCLMVEELSPGLSAFYAIVAQVISDDDAASDDRAVPP